MSAAFFNCSGAYCFICSHFCLLVSLPRIKSREAFVVSFSDLTAPVALFHTIRVLFLLGMTHLR